MCTSDDHNKLKTDPARLANETDVGKPQKDENGVVEFYWRDCPSCASSLAVEPETETSARLLIAN